MKKTNKITQYQKCKIQNKKTNKQTTINYKNYKTTQYHVSILILFNLVGIISIKKTSHESF